MNYDETPDKTDWKKISTIELLLVFFWPIPMAVLCLLGWYLQQWLNQ